MSFQVMHTSHEGKSGTSWLTALVGILIICITALAYWKGLSGSFMFDDIKNLEALGSLGGIRDWQTLSHYLSNANAGPTGRPIAMLTFVLNANDWPAGAYPFKLTNLLLHLICGILLGIVSYRLVRLLNPKMAESTTAFVALLTAGWWLLNPLHVSTTLYVIQRMAQLSAAFSLIGILCYLHGRSMLSTRPKAGHVWMTASILVCGALATLSKENGALLPSLILLTEITILRKASRETPSKIWAAFFLWVPSLMVVAYLLWVGTSSEEISKIRSFSISERLMTEARIFWDYLYQLVIPRIDSGRVFGDDVVISRSLLSPLSTMPAIIGLGVAIALSWRQRSRLPLFSFAFLFFLIGHLIESTTIPLEPYFEHRNYLPSMFLALPIALSIFHSRPPISKNLLVIGTSSILVIYATITWQRASLWSNTDLTYLYWAQQRPYSIRAQTAAISAYMRLGQPQLAHDTAITAIRSNPNSLLLKLELVRVSKQPENLAQALADLLSKARTSALDQQFLGALQQMIEDLENKRIRRNSIPILSAIIKTLLENNHYHDRSTQNFLHRMQARVHLANNRIDLAMASYLRTGMEKDSLEPALLMVSLLASSGHLEEAMTILQRAKKTAIDYNLPKLKRNYYLTEIGRMETNLRHDIQAQAALAPSQ